MIENFTAHTGSVTTLARMNVRRGLPGTHAPLAMKVEPGTRMSVLGIGPGQDVMGNATWFAGLDDTYFWSGACSSFRAEITDGIAVRDMTVSRRADGTIRPLSDSQLPTVFGRFDYAEAAGGRIRIDPDWVAANIVDHPTPLLDDLGYTRITIHKDAARSFDAVFAKIEQAGLAGKLLTCAGTFVPRHKGWNPRRGLSSHSWGVAIDFNVAWNGYGKTPAPLGAVGSVRELVPFFESEGFAWGGYFSPPYEDGMHFELARQDL